MKKLFAFVLILTFILNLPISASAEDRIADAVILSADKSYTNKTRSASSDVVLEFSNLIMSAKNSRVKQEDVKPLAVLYYETDGKLSSGMPIYKNADGIYLKRGTVFRQLDADKFYSLTDKIGADFYMFRQIPTAKTGDKTLAVTSSDYTFERLDGKFYKSPSGNGAVPTVTLQDGKLPVPSFSMKAKEVNVTVLRTGEGYVWKGLLQDIGGFKPEKDGVYTVSFKVVYSQIHAKGTVVYQYNINRETGIDFTMSGAKTSPGEIVVLRAKNVPEGADISINTKINYSPKFFREKGGDMVALLPVSYYTAPGVYTVEFKCGNFSKTLGVSVGEKSFPVQNLTVPPETAAQTIESKKADDEYEKYMVPVRKISDDKQYWSGRFIWPLKVERRVTTQFGVIRYTNGSKTPSRHGAVDLAAAAGTPVYASNAGRVVYSGFLQLTGNTVVIEHGYGLKTWYYHMNGLNVKTGDIVKQGQQIGIVGSTGFSTGAHLHFGMSVSNAVSGNSYMNPETAINTDLLAELAKNASYEALE